MSLVAHYTLDRQANVKPNMCTNTNTSSATWYYGGANGAYSHYQKGYIHHFSCTRADTSWQYLSYNNFLRTYVVANKKYTISFFARSNTSLDMSVRFLNGDGTQTMSSSVTMNNIPATNTWTLVKGTVTASASFTVSSQVVYFGGTNKVCEFEIYNMKVEEGEVATPWIPNPADSLFATNPYNREFNIASNAYHGTWTGTPGYITDTPKYKCSTQFNGSTYCTLASSINLNFSTGCTVACWVKINSASAEYSIFSNQSGGPVNAAWKIVSGKQVLFHYDGSWKTTTATNAMNTSNWYHVVYVITGYNITFYLNGVANGTGSASLNYANSVNDIIGAQWSYGAKYNGYMSDFRVYNHALSATDVATLYNGGIVASYEQLAWIEKNGSAYIDTGYAPTIPFQVDCDMEITGEAVRDYWFGQRQGHGSMMYNGLYNNNTLEFNWGVVSRTASNRCKMTQNNNGDGTIKIIMNGVTTNTSIGANDEGGGNFYIFACSSGNRPYGSAMKLYDHFVIKANNQIIRNFVPAKRKSDNAIGLFDLCTRTFYGNGGSGSFTAGPKIGEIE